MPRELEGYRPQLELPPALMQRLSDIAYGMMLAQESKKEQDKQTA